MDRSAEMQALCARNIRLAAYFADVAVRIRPRLRRLRRDDRISAAMLGLWRACRHYDASHNCTLSTYAGRPILHEIQRLYEAQCGAVVIPADYRSRKSPVLRALGRQAERIPWTLSIRESRTESHHQSSLDEPSYAVWLDRRRREDAMPDIEKVHLAMHKLLPRHADYLHRRYWLGQTLRQIADADGITPECVRMHLVNAVRKIRNILLRMGYDAR